jgi:hypothetical protein
MICRERLPWRSACPDCGRNGTEAVPYRMARPHDAPTRTTGTVATFRVERTIVVFAGTESHTIRVVDNEASRSCGTPLRQRI